MIAHNFKTLLESIRRHFSEESYVVDGPLLVSLFEIAFLASTIADEGRNVTCSISVFGPHQTINDEPDTVRTNRWSIIPLTDPIPLTPESLARISQAIQPHAGAIAVRPTLDGSWSIWAIIDQEHLISGFRRHKRDDFYTRAGKFQVEIVGPGCIALYHDSFLLARLQRDSVEKDFQDIFHEGPLAEALDSLAEKHVSRVLRVLRRWRGPNNDLGHGAKRIGLPVESLKLWLERSKESWLRALSGILLEIRGFHHGGAFLLIPRAIFDDLNVKYKINYPRMNDVLAERCGSDIMARGLRHFGLDIEYEEQLRDILSELGFAELRKSDAVGAEAGTHQFIASLSGVDGLVLAVRGLEIRGFGVEILTKRDPADAYLAMDPSGATSERIDPTRWGTRHRSMMRYCARHRGSIGFVVSQDGDVRAMMRVAERLLIWPNVDLERSAMLPFETPCPHCSSVGGLFPVRLVDNDENVNSFSDRGKDDPLNRVPTN